MKQARDMKVIGGKGGRARAQALGAQARSDIARRAAVARWTPKKLVLATPRNHGELQCFVAQYKNGYAPSTCRNPTAVLHRAIAAARKDACLARMLPVFIWRGREDFLKAESLTQLPAQDACALGYFLELAFRFGGSNAADEVILRLRQRARGVEPFVFFRLMENAFSPERTVMMTSPAARAWNLILGEPDEGYESHFRKFPLGTV